MKTTADYMEERVELYEWLKRIEAGPLGPDEIRHLNRELLQRGLARQDDLNHIVVTQKGKQFSFRLDCERALQWLAEQTAVPADEQVLQWLLSERFVLEPTKADEYWRVTPRGRAWLESLAHLPCDSSLSERTASALQ